MDTIQILWVDDEIDLLKPHILFLQKKNYEVTTCNNGRDAVDIFDDFDTIFILKVEHLRRQGIKSIDDAFCCCCLKNAMPMNQKI